MAYRLNKSREKLESYLADNSFPIKDEKGIKALRESFIEDWSGITRHHVALKTFSEEDYTYASKIIYAHSMKEVDECVVNSIEFLKTLEEYMKISKEFNRSIRSKSSRSSGRMFDQPHILKSEANKWELKYKSIEYRILSLLDDRTKIHENEHIFRIGEANQLYEANQFTGPFFEFYNKVSVTADKSPLSERTGLDILTAIKDQANQTGQVDIGSIAQILASLTQNTGSPTQGKPAEITASSIPRMKDKMAEIEAVAELIDEHEEVIPEGYPDSYSYMSQLSDDAERLRAIEALCKVMGPANVQAHFNSQ